MSDDKKDGVTPESPAKKPWPMIWVVIAILGYAVIHMTVMLLG